MRIKSWAAPFSRLPIKWRLTLGSALLLFLLFAAYNAAQYWFVEQWMFKKEKAAMQNNMDEILNYFLEREASFSEEEMTQIRTFLQKVNRQKQLVRILDETGKPIAVVSNEVPAEWVTPHTTAHTTFSKEQEAGQLLLVIRSPLTIFQFNGTIEIVKNTEEFKNLTEALLQVMILCGIGAVLISGLGGMLLARQLLGPLQSMAEAIRNVKQKGLHERVGLRPDSSQDEIAALMKLFNEMMDQVERSFQQQRQFVEDASHELRTPVAIVEGHLSLLRRWGKSDPQVLEESLEASIQEIARLKGLVQELLELTRAEQSGQDVPAVTEDPEKVIETIAKKISALNPTLQISCDAGVLQGTAVAIGEQHLEQILLILLDNAVKYSESREINITAQRLADHKVCISITDFGIGIPERDLPHVLDRFYRVDKARSGAQGGHGLGLAIAKRLAERHGGMIEIRSKEHAGTTVSVFLQTIALPTESS
ncbi:ATP-binding protein [Paenibacillus sp. GCM10027626]|uniref:HAMP domain-containing sensor histidine kinase n=1 Tax=Paenibacillus sp. GCM10027626 TaxID=3273411 RepID=UPI00363017C0